MTAIDAENAPGILCSNQFTDASLFQRKSNLGGLGRHLLTRDEVVIPHHYPPIILGDFLGQDSEVLVTFGCFCLTQCILRPLSHAGFLLRRSVVGDNQRNRLNRNRLGRIESCWVLLIEGLYFFLSNGCLLYNFALQEVLDHHRTPYFLSQISSRAIALGS